MMAKQSLHAETHFVIEYHLLDDSRSGDRAPVAFHAPLFGLLKAFWLVV